MRSFGKLAIGLIVAVTVMGAAIPARLQGSLDLELDGVRGITLDNYNRVDGLPVSYGLHGGNERVDFSIRAIYRMASERVGWRGALSVGLWDRRGPVFTVETSSAAETSDRWRPGALENSLSSILFKEDFRNYDQRQGFSLGLQTLLKSGLEGRVVYRYHRYSSLRAVAEFSFFGWDKEFRANPPVDEGWMGSLSLEMALDTRDDPIDPAAGWYHEFSFEVSDPALGGEFDYRQARWTLCRFNRVGAGTNLDMRFLGSLSSRRVPPQRGVHIHGVGGLRGFPDDFDPRDQAVMASIEARFDLNRVLKRVPLYRDRMRILLFSEIGGCEGGDSDRAWQVDSDIGIGLEGSGLFTYDGIFLAFGLGDRRDGPRLTFRVRRDF